MTFGYLTNPRPNPQTAGLPWGLWMAGLLLCCAACDPGAPAAGGAALHRTPELSLHHLQFLGSHNSYKQAIDPSLFALLSARNPDAARALAYEHPSLTEQLQGGLRKLELDIFYDPAGGRYATPSGIAQVSQAGLAPGPEFDPEGVMQQPGFKVLHLQDLDFRSNCLTLQRCLAELRAWSRAHPRHLPVVVTVNAKDQPIEGLTDPLPFDAAAFDALDAEVLAALGRERLLLPDDVRGDLASLEAAVLARGWPSLEALRGRFLFVLDEGGSKLATYIDGHPALAGRVFFVNAEPGTPEAAFRIVNDPVGRADEIRSLVQRGYLVRTRADADTEEARSGDTARRDAAFASGAHYVSTDYALANPFGSGYTVALPGGGSSRCNPVSAPPGCIPPGEFAPKID